MNKVWAIQKQGLVVATVLLQSVVASAQAEGTRGLPALIHVALPTPAAPAAAALGVGYGWLDPLRDDQGGHRLQGQVAAAITPLPALSFAVDVRGRLDTYPSAGEANSVNLYGEPRLTGRYALAVAPDTFLGVELDVRLLGAEAPSIKAAATSPSVRALYGQGLTRELWIGANLGFHWDRSGQAVPRPELMSGPDKRSLGASSWSAVQWGAGAGYQLQTLPAELLLELTGELLVGRGSPGVGRSPSQLSVGVRLEASPSWAVLGTIDTALSSRRPAAHNERLLPAEPRVAAGVALVWRVDPTPAPVAPPAPIAPVSPPKTETELPPPAPAVVTSPVSGSIVDEGGHALADVEVTLTQAGSEPQQTRTFADGTFEFKEVPAGEVELQIVTPGFDKEVIPLKTGEDRKREITLRAAIPAGQVRGAVLDFEGKPVAASVTIGPEKKQVEVRPDGSFELELAPGSYTVTFRAERYQPQQRRIVVRDHGVVILNIALTR
jgi:hypothetical protein